MCGDVFAKSAGFGYNLLLIITAWPASANFI